MKQETWIQIIALIVLVALAIFYNPEQATFEGKILFFSIILAMVLFLIVFDLYKKVDGNKLKIKLFEEKFDLKNRIKELETWKENIKNKIPKNKKGQIDPRIILLIIIIILIYLYIKSQQ